MFYKKVLWKISQTLLEKTDKVSKNWKNEVLNLSK